MNLQVQQEDYFFWIFTSRPTGFDTRTIILTTLLNNKEKFLNRVSQNRLFRHDYNDYRLDYTANNCHNNK